MRNKLKKISVLLTCSMILFVFTNATVPVMTDTNLKKAIESKFKTKKTTIEKTWMFKSLKYADSLAKLTYVYAPSHKPGEYNPHGLAYQGIVLVRAYKTAIFLNDKTRAANYRVRIFKLADSLAANSNFDDTQLSIYKKDFGSSHRNAKAYGLTGWGMFYDDKDESPKHIYKGGYTVDVGLNGCNPLDKNNRQNVDRAYQELAFSTSWVVRFLLEAARDIPGARSSWSKSADLALKSFIKKTGSSYLYAWTLKEKNKNPAYFYFNKTTGPCSSTFLIKNINMIMGVAYELGYRVLKNKTYYTISELIRATNNFEIRKKNFGYYSIRHVRKLGISTSAKNLKKVSAHQKTTSTETVCTSMSCLLHLSLEAHAYMELGHLRGYWKSSNESIVKSNAEVVHQIVDNFSDRVRALEGNQDLTNDYPNQLVGQVCAIRNLPKYTGSQGLIDLKRYCEDQIGAYKGGVSPYIAMSFLEL